MLGGLNQRSRLQPNSNSSWVYTRILAETVLKKSTQRPQSSAFAAAPARLNDSGYQPSLGYGAAGRICRLPSLTNNRSSCRNCTPYHYSSGNSCRSSYMRVGLPQTQSRKSPPRKPKREFWYRFSYGLSLLMEPRLAPAKR
jgi:hypothetical protein